MVVSLESLTLSFFFVSLDQQASRRPGSTSRQDLVRVVSQVVQSFSFSHVLSPAGGPQQQQQQQQGQPGRPPQQGQGQFGQQGGWRGGVRCLLATRG
jgi:hypothetical protein